MRIVKSAAGEDRIRVLLQRRANSFALSATKGQETLNLRQLVKQRESLAPLEKFLTTKTPVFVPITSLQELKSVLGGIQDKGVETSISPEVDSLQQGDIPEDFEIRYEWSETKTCLTKSLTLNAFYVGGGWILGQDRYWSLGDVKAMDEEWLTRKSVEGEDLLTFLRDVLPSWRKRVWPVVCPVEYSDQCILSIALEELAGENASLQLHWRVPPESIQEIQFLKSHVFSSNRISPGISPRALNKLLSFEDGIYELSLEEIPVFLQMELPKIQPWVEGQIETFLSDHYNLLCSPKAHEQEEISPPDAAPLRDETLSSPSPVVEDVQNASETQPPIEEGAPLDAAGVEEPLPPEKPPVEDVTEGPELTEGPIQDSEWHPAEFVVDLDRDAILEDLEQFLGGRIPEEIQEPEAHPLVSEPEGLQEPERPLDDKSETRIGDAMVHVILNGLNEEDKQLITWLTQNRWELELGALQQALPTVNLQASIQRINKRTLAVLETMLIASGSGRKIICDEFRDALGRILAPGAGQPDES